MPSDTLNDLIFKCHTKLVDMKRTGGRGAQIIGELLTERLNLIEHDCATKWSTASDEEKKNCETRLQALLESICLVAYDGPTDPASEMFKDFASNKRVIWISLWAIAGVVGMILLVLLQARQLYHCGMPTEVVSALPLVATMGALGGFLSCIQSFGRYVGNRQFLRSWTIYYLLFPLKGAGLAIIVFFLVQINLGQQNLNLSGNSNLVGTNNALVKNNTVNTSAVDRGTTEPSQLQNGKQPNLVLAAMLAALTGMFANQAIEMLASVFSIVFSRVKGKDGYRDDGL